MLRWREGQGLLDYRPVGLDINMTGHTVTLRPWVRYTARWGHGGVPRVEFKPSGPGSSHRKTRLMNAGAIATPANWVLIRSGLCEHCVSTVYVKKSLPGHRQGVGEQRRGSLKSWGGGGVWILSYLPRLHTCPLQGCGTEKAYRFWHCDEVAFSSMDHVTHVFSSSTLPTCRGYSEGSSRNCQSFRGLSIKAFTA